MKLDLSAVRNEADASAALLVEQLSKLDARGPIVVFLGEEHRNKVDEAVTHHVLNKPPLMPPGSTRVIFERGLDAVYFPERTLTTRTERLDYGLSRMKRSELTARMIKDAFEEHGMRVVYVPCGSAHRDEIFEALDAISTSEFTLISRPSSTD